MDFLPGEPTSALQASCLTKWNHHSIFTYASGNNLIILTGLMKKLQTVYFQHDLICIDINSITGDIAVCDSQNTLFIYRSINQDDCSESTQDYIYAGSIYFGDKYSIKGICWGNEKEIIIGTQNIILLYYICRLNDSNKSNFRLIWEFPIGIPCYLIKFSQNSELISLIGKNDKLLKIFYRSNFDPDNTKFQLILLKQNSIITDFKFRFIDLNKDYLKKNDNNSVSSIISSSTSSNYNILYTINEDNFIKVFLSFEFEKLKKIQHWGSLKLNNSTALDHDKNKSEGKNQAVDNTNENFKYIKFIDNYFLKYLILRSSDRLQRDNPTIAKTLSNNLDKLLDFESDMILVIDKYHKIDFYLVTNLNAKPPKEINFLKLQFNDSILFDEKSKSYNEIFFKLPDGMLPSDVSNFTLFSDNLKIYNKKFFQQKFLEDNHNKITFGNVNQFKNKNLEISNKGDLCFLLHDLTEKLIKVIYIRFDNIFKFIDYKSLFRKQIPQNNYIILSSRRKSSVSANPALSNESSVDHVPTKQIELPHIKHDLQESSNKKFLELHAVLGKNITGHTKSVQKLVSNRYDNVLLSFLRFNEHKMWNYNDGILLLKCIIDYDLAYAIIVQNSNLIFGFNKSGTKLVYLNCENFHSKIIEEIDLTFLNKVSCFFKISKNEFDYIIFIYENMTNDYAVKCWKINSANSCFSELEVNVSNEVLATFKSIACLSVNDNSGDEIENGDILSTITKDGVLRSYAANIKNDTVLLSITNTIFTNISNAEYIKGSSIKKVAVVNDEKKQLFIYNTNYGMLEYSYVFELPVKDIDWECIDYKIGRTNRNNPSLLSVGFDNNVILFSQLNFDYTNDMPAFAPIKSLEFAQTSHNISDSVWLNGILFVGSGNQIIFYDCTAKNSLSWEDIVGDKYTKKIIGDRLLSSNKITSILHLVELLNNTSPLYHPQVLIQCIYWGKIQTAKTILLKLYLYLKQVTPEENDTTTDDDDDDDSVINKESVLKKFKAKDLPANLGLKISEFYKDVNPLDNSSEKEEDSLYSAKNFNTWVEYLKELITKISLPVLTRHQQITLVTVIESLELIDNNKDVLSMSDGNPDICSVNFLLGFKLFQSHYKSQLSLNMRDNIFAVHSQKQKVLLNILANSIGDTSEFYWMKVKAYGMTCWLEDKLLINQFEKIANNEFQNSSFLPKGIDKSLRNQYIYPLYYEKSPAKNPINSMIFYLALRKKQIIISLWKISHGHPEKEKMIKFLNNDFTQEKYKVVALKNAFSLLSKHRFLLSACFFLLAGKLQDCCRVLIKQCEDIDLAMGVARVYQLTNKMRSLDKENHFHNILIDNLLPIVLQQGNRWLNSYIYYCIQEPKLLMLSLIETPYNVLKIACENKEFLKNEEFWTKLHTALKDFGGNSDDRIDGNNFVKNDPILAVLYQELRSKLSSRHSLGISERELVGFVNKFDKEEFTFVLRVALIYSRMGCDALSLPVMRNWKFSSIYFSDVVERVRQSSIISKKINENGNAFTTLNTANSNSINSNLFKQDLEPTSNTVEEFNFDNFGF